MSLVTILTPAYNAAATLLRTIESAQQSKHTIQHIVIDDCSTDGTVLDATEAGVTVCMMGANGGPAAALNEAIEGVFGQYVMTLEADDWLEPYAIDALVALMERGAGFAYGWTRYYGQLTHTHVPRTPAHPDHFYDRFESLYAVMFRREAFERGARWHTFAAGYGVHDWDFTLQLVELGYRPSIHEGVVLHYDYQPSGLNARLAQKNAEYLRELKARHPQVRATLV